MPSQSHSGVRGDPWQRCDRCGFDFPLSQLQMQNGLLLDAKCIDGTTMFRRDYEVAARLRDRPEEMKDMVSEKRRFPNVVQDSRP